MIRSTIMVVALLSASQVWSWGDTGHRIICEIAFQELTDAARTEVMRLIHLDDEFTQFNDSCVWPDHPRKRPTEHYVNYPRKTRQITTESCLTADRCLLSAITLDLAVLGNNPEMDEAKLASLKFLGHWVGDLHQPMHVSFQDDRGGNDVRESGGPCEGNIHAVWDTCIIKERLIKYPRFDWRVRSLARRLHGTLTNPQRDEWNSSRVSTWANESFQITIAPNTNYCDLHSRSCFYDLATDRERYTKGEERKKAVIDRDYIETHVPIVEQRLLRAGARLGGLINEAFGP